jgi:LytS/YehU family sensor histidine kinase
VKSLFASRWANALFIVFWVGYVGVFAYFTGKDRGPAFGILMAVDGAFFHLLAIVINLSLLVPRLLQRGKNGTYILAVTALALVCIVLRMNTENVIAGIYNVPTESPVRHFLATASLVVLFLLLFTMFKFSVDWFEQEKARRELETQKLTAELNYLKAQINPHFFFNTLNNLYSLAIKNAPETPDVILKLSELMRYMLYESKEERVALPTELEYLKSFIDLQLLRVADDMDFQYTLTGEAGGHLIEPMLFLPLVENAFKHARKNEKGFYIDVSLDVQPQRITMQVANSYQPSTASARKHSSGIGLQNVRRRLELLYPQRHELTVAQTPNEYRTKLTLTI